MNKYKNKGNKRVLSLEEGKGGKGGSSMLLKRVKPTLNLDRYAIPCLDGNWGGGWRVVSVKSNHREYITTGLCGYIYTLWGGGGSQNVAYC